MLKRIKESYPKAKVYCCTLLKTFSKKQDDWQFPNCFGGIEFAEYNKAIRKAVKKEKCILIDLASTSVKYETLDGTHPTVNGHKIIADTFINLLKEG